MGVGCPEREEQEQVTGQHGVVSDALRTAAPNDLAGATEAVDRALRWCVPVSLQLTSHDIQYRMIL